MATLNVDPTIVITYVATMFTVLLSIQAVRNWQKSKRALFESKRMLSLYHTRYAELRAAVDEDDAEATVRRVIREFYLPIGNRLN